MLIEKQGGRARRSCRELHIGVEADIERIVASSPIAYDVVDTSKAESI